MKEKIENLYNRDNNGEYKKIKINEQITLFWRDKIII